MTDSVHCKNEVLIPHHWCNIRHCKSGNHTKIGVLDTSQCHIFTVYNYLTIPQFNGLTKCQQLSVTDHDMCFIVYVCNVMITSFIQ